MRRALPLIACLVACLPAMSAETRSLGDVKQLDSRVLTSDPEGWPGAKLYAQHCAMCHGGQVPKAPHKMFLQMMSGPTVLAALTDGLMASQGAGLSVQQRTKVAEYLSGAPLSAQHAARPVPMCDAKGQAAFDTGMPVSRSGWGYDNARHVPGEVAKLAPGQVPKLKLAWAVEFPSALRARSQPSIAWGSVFVGSQDGTVYALDLGKGCARWKFKAGAEVRTAVVPYLLPGAKAPVERVYFGDVIGRVYSLDARSGALLWSRKIDDHANATLTGTALFHDGTIFAPVSSLEVTTAADPDYECCTFRGAIVALDAATGEERWKTHTVENPPAPVRTTDRGTRIFGPSGAPIWNMPAVDEKRGVLYAGSGENYSSPADDRSDALFAFRESDGKRVWHRQMTANDAWNVACMMKDNPNCPDENGPDIDFASGAILAHAGGRDLLIAGQKNGIVYALDPDEEGRVVWQTRVGRGGLQGGVHFGMSSEGDRIFVPIADMADARDGRPVVGPAKPGLYALDVATGQLLWSSPAPDRCNGLEFCDPGISAAITSIPGVVFAGHMDGWFRAYDSRDGKVLFEYDSKLPVATVNGTTAKGGSFGGGGPVVRDGYVVVNSGYGIYFHMPGNVLLAFR